MEKCKICKKEMTFVQPYSDGPKIKCWQCPKCMWKEY